MPINFGDHGLAYTHDLCTAIEQYTAQEVNNNPEAFTYRGLQLRYAVERWLYIHCINSEALFCHYMANRRGDRAHSNLPTLNGFESDVNLFFSSTRVLPKRSLKRRVRWLLKITRRTWDWLKQRARHARKANSTVQRSEILIQTVNAKFAKYLEPILGVLAQGSYSFLITNDAKLGEQLSENGHQIITYYADRIDCQFIFSYALSEFTQLIHEADSLMVALREIKPACVLVVEGNAPGDAIISEVCRLQNIPCYCVQHGWSPYVHNGFRNMNFTEMFVWGPQFAELLRPHNPNQIFSVTGVHFNDNNQSILSRERIETLSFFLQAPCALLGFEAYNGFVDLIIDVAQAHPGVKVIVRSHPDYPIPAELMSKLTACPNAYFSVPTTEPLADVIATSDLVISVFSTVLLEAMAMSVPPLICSIGAIKKYQPDIASSGGAIEVHSVAEARQAIDNFIAEPARLAEIRKCTQKISDTYFSKEDGAALIAKHLQSAAQTARKQG